MLTARSREDYRATEAWTGTLSIVFGVLSLILGSLAAWAITRSLTRPLEGAVARRWHRQRAAGQQHRRLRQR